VQLGLLLVAEVIQVQIVGTPAVFVGIDLVLDAVDTGHQNGGVAEIGVAGGIGVTQLETALVGSLGVGRDTDDGAAVGGGVTHGDGRLEAGHQTLEGVGAGVGEGAQRADVLQQAAHEPVRFAAQVCVAVIVGEDGLAVLEQQHMHVHAAAGLAVDGLGHEGGALAVLQGSVVDDILDHHGGVGHLGQLAQLGLDLKLAGSSHFGVVIVDLDAGVLHVHAHLATALVGDVEGLGDVIGLLLGYDAALALVGAVPVGLDGVHGHADAVGLEFPTYLIEQIELEFGQDHHGVGDAAILHVLVGSQHDITGILGQRAVFRVVDDHGVAGHGQSGDGAEGIDHGSVGVGDKDHVALFHHGIAVVGGVKADAVFHGIFGEVFRGDGHMAELAVDVDHFEVHHLNVFLADEIHDFLDFVIQSHTPSSVELM